MSDLVVECSRCDSTIKEYYENKDNEILCKFCAYTHLGNIGESDSKWFAICQYCRFPGAANV